MATEARKEARIFLTDGIPHLTLRNHAGAIRVLAGEVGQVAVEATTTANAPTAEQAAQLLRDVAVTIERTGDAITVDVQRHHARGGFFRGFSHTRVDLIVTMPARSDLAIDANAAHVAVSGISGAMRLTANAGKVTLTDVTLMETSRLDLNAGALTGAITLAPATRATLTLNAGVADLALPERAETRVEATATAGSIHIEGWDLAVRRGVASARLDGVLGEQALATLVISANAGTIRLRRRVRVATNQFV